MRKLRLFTLTTTTLLFLVFAVASVQAAWVQLAWNPPLNSAGIPLAGYRVYRKPANGIYRQQLRKEITDSQVTSVTLSNLKEGNAYHFVTAAFDSSGSASEYSNEVSTTLAPDNKDSKTLLPAQVVTASAWQEPNVPVNTQDGTLHSRWAAEGHGQWIAYDLGSSMWVCQVAIAWYRGDWRQSAFTIEVSVNSVDWTPVYSGNSSGQTLELEPYAFAAVPARYVRIIGYGNTENWWTSITEVTISGSQDASEPPTPTPNPEIPQILSVQAVTASAWQKPNVPVNTQDGTLHSRWAAEGHGQWIAYDLGSSMCVSQVAIAWYQGAARRSAFAIEVSTDGTVWSTVYSGNSSGQTLELEPYAFAAVPARHIRIIGYGNTSNTWTSITEVELYGSQDTSSIPQADTDGDGLTDRDERELYGTEPLQADTDGDELSDGVEIQLGTDPLNADSDGDGLEDGEEVQFFATDPLNPDSDGDEVEDGEEVLQGTDPLVAGPSGNEGSPTDGEGSEPAPAPAPPATGTTVLGIQGSQFTLNEVPTFLYGITYAAGLGASQAFIEQDLDDMQRFGFNWLRVWATRNRFDNDTSAVDATGQPRPTFMAKLKWLVAECERRGMVVDITLSRRDQPAFYDLAKHRRAVETLAIELRDYRNWYLDMANERNGEVSFIELQQLRNAIKGLDPQRLVTASHSFDISLADLEQYLFTAHVDFIAPHRQRSSEANQETEVVTRRYLEQMSALGRVVPVHYQEPFRRGYHSWQPEVVDFVDNLRLSWQGGAAGWAFHNGDQRKPLLAPNRDPRRSADMRDKRLFDQLDTVEYQAMEEMQDFTERLIFHN
jgi:hypothetical protein